MVSLLIWLPGRSKQPQLSAANTEAAGPSRDQEELHQKYSRVRSVHMVATTKISIYEASIREGTGQFEYWAEGNRYRTSCHTDPQLELLSDTDIAYDGFRFSYFDRGAGLVSHRAQDEERSFGACLIRFSCPWISSRTTPMNVHSAGCA